MSNLNRRTLIKQLAAGSFAVSSFEFFQPFVLSKKNQLKNNLNHSVCRWTYNAYSLDELCKIVKEIGFHAIDLVGPKDWPVLKKNDVFSSMCNGAEISLTEGWNNEQYHSTLIKNYLEHIDLVSSAGYKNLICFSGNRR